jgi:hypothetical protein
MKIAFVSSLAILLAVGYSARADSIQTAYAAVSSSLQKDGGGLVPLLSQCPKSNADPWEFATSATVAAINQADSAVLVNTGHCGGGNGVGQYLVIIQGGVGRLVNGTEIGDMSFLGSHMSGDGETLTIFGDKWMPDDPHCCPSKKASLEYDLRTRRHILTVLGN